ncbi:MAG: hypothetical protein GWP06_16915 [Actinobacteria bacterium]|nr:hypothetical protein [Actinomycetota bacterium]
METPLAQKFIITNVYPFSLVRRKMIAVPVELKDVIVSLKSGTFASAWGHRNTLEVVNKMLGVDITPASERPAIVLDAQYFPTLNGDQFTKVVLVSPNFKKGFRPKIGEEVPEKAILGWQALLLDFE